MPSERSSLFRSGPVKYGSIRLNHAQILALNDNNYVIVPPINIINYEGYPDTFPVIKYAYASTNIVTQYASDVDVKVFIGGDGSALAFSFDKAILTTVGKNIAYGTGITDVNSLYGATFLEDNLQDDAIVVCCNPIVISGGHVDNWLNIIVEFVSIPLV